MNKGTLVVVSGFSGAGKGTVLSQVFQRRPDLYFSVSFTTRAPRTGEQDGVDYHFITREAFEERIHRGEFLEYAEYVGNYYGTSLKVIQEKLDRGTTLVYTQTGYLKKEQPMILTVVSNRELMRLNQIVQETDPQAFMIIGNVNEVRGRGFSTQKVYKNEVGMNE